MVNKALRGGGAESAQILTTFGTNAVNYSNVQLPINNCLFIGNRTFKSEGLSASIFGASGGAIDNFEDSNPVLTNCTLYGTSANIGGGIHSLGSSPTLSNRCA